VKKAGNLFFLKFVRKTILWKTETRNTWKW